MVYGRRQSTPTRARKYGLQFVLDVLKQATANLFVLHDVHRIEANHRHAAVLPLQRMLLSALAGLPPLDSTLGVI